jgi:uncharacterized protein YfaS (alpha-2-macroglobulin family)
MTDFVIANAGPSGIYPLELVAAASHALERTATAAASFAYTVEGARHVVPLEPGEAFTVALSPRQRETLGFVTLSGQVAVVASWRSPVDPASLATDSDLKLTRRQPANPVARDQLVTVRLTAEFGRRAPNGCYDVTELVPSGLAPLMALGYRNEDSGVVSPTSVVGQEVRFCAFVDPKHRGPVQMRYTARVVNEGAFAWEPAIMQLAGAPEALARTQAGTSTIGGQ